MCTHQCNCMSCACLWRPEEGFRSPWAWLWAPCGCWELNFHPLRKYQVLLTTEPSLQTLPVFGALSQGLVSNLWYRQEWPWKSSPPVSASQELGWQAWFTMPAVYNTGDGTQGFMHDRPALYQLSSSPVRCFLRQSLICHKSSLNSLCSQDDLKLLILLPPLTECRSYSHVPPCRNSWCLILVIDCWLFSAGNWLCWLFGAWRVNTHLLLVVHC